MFDVGFQELTLIGVIALIVVGPERLPKMARTIGLWMGKIRYYVGQVKSDIDREVRAQELKEMLDKPAKELDDLYKVAEETKGTLDEAKGCARRGEDRVRRDVGERIDRERAGCGLDLPDRVAGGDIGRGTRRGAGAATAGAASAGTRSLVFHRGVRERGRPRAGGPAGTGRGETCTAGHVLRRTRRRRER